MTLLVFCRRLSSRLIPVWLRWPGTAVVAAVAVTVVAVTAVAAVEAAVAAIEVSFAFLSSV